jgi:hypothetical protein
MELPRDGGNADLLRGVPLRRLWPTQAAILSNLSALKSIRSDCFAHDHAWAFSCKACFSASKDRAVEALMRKI